MRRQVLQHAVIVRARALFRRADGTRFESQDNAAAT